MPRKRRLPKVRRHAPAEVSRGIYVLLLWGDFDEAARLIDEDGDDPWPLFDNGTHAALWRAIEREALGEWIAEYPGTRPPSWWRWSAPDLRLIFGGGFVPSEGLHRCQPTGIPYGTPDWDDPPSVESQAAYLDRHGLWLASERERVPAAAFEPQVFDDWALTVAPCNARLTLAAAWPRIGSVQRADAGAGNSNADPNAVDHWPV